MTKTEQAQHDLERLVVPLLCSDRGGRAMIVETRPDQVATDLDVDAGIDVYLRFDRGPISTWATRIQWRHYGMSSAPWANRAAPMTYTIRARTDDGNDWTELAKRATAITTGGLYPRWTLQAYIERPGGPVENMAWCQTVDLYAHLSAYRDAHIEIPTRRGPGGAIFTYVEWRNVPGYRWFRESADRRLAQPRMF